MKEIIATRCGEIRGTECQWTGVTSYKGIRYATADRWKYPALVEQWDGVYEADHYGDCCYQPRSFYNEEKVVEKQFYYNEFRKGVAYNYSDDCLFLNIWVPEHATPQSKLPVIMYIHGGGFTGGCGHEKHFDGPIWPTKGVIAVTINYRLGPIGFLCLPELEKEAGRTGNYGLYDQIAALTWVYRNISDFGGDPKNITIMGQSAGAMSVQLLVMSPLTDGMIAKAVMNSGGGVSKLLNSKQTYADRYGFWQKVTEELGCKTLDELRSVEVSRLFDIWKSLAKSDRKYSMIASPCIDHNALTDSNFNLAMAGKQKAIPYMMGSTSEDIMPPIIHGMAKKWCILQDIQNKCKSFCWFFDRKLPGDDNGAWHSSELWYFFGTLNNGWRPFTEKDFALSDEIVTALCNFANNGNPNRSGEEKWIPTTRNQKKVYHFGEGISKMANCSRLKMIYTMLTKKAVGE